MRTMKFLFYAACLCSAGVFARTAMTQEKTLTPVDPPGEKEDFPPERLERSAPRDPNGELPIGGAAFWGGKVEPPSSRDRDTRRGGFSAGIGGGGGLMGRGEDLEESPVRPRMVTRTVTQMIYEPIPIEELQARQKLQAAVQSLRTGKDDAARKAAADVIQQHLTAQFETDLKQREKELTEVEQRVKTLREQLDKRKAAQADIINLRLQTLVNDANGLGFPDTNFGTNAQNDPRQFTDDYDIGLPGPRQSAISPTFDDPNRPDPRLREYQPEPDQLEPVFEPDNP